MEHGVAAALRTLRASHYLGGAILDTVGCCAASSASTHWVPGTPLTQVWPTKTVSICCQTSPGGSESPHGVGTCCLASGFSWAHLKVVHKQVRCPEKAVGLTRQLPVQGTT